MPSPRHARPPRLARALACACAALLVSGCAVVSVAGAVTGAAVTVAGAAVGATVTVAGKVVEKSIDLALPSPSPAR